ncbi:hypothetical protein Q3101_30215 [Streptomyces sp. VNUA74]|nr:hypothetical protein [Streptomyces sp. VNUA74]WML83872.1 hypothetical protein Q3101_30215 [Streptomyces sp. VNUA74]
MDGEHLVPAVGRRVHEATPAGVARVVDQQVEGVASRAPEEFPVRLLEQVRNRLRVDEVRVQREGTASRPLDGRDRLFGAATVSSAPRLLAL